MFEDADYQKIKEKIGYSFLKKEYLQEAFTHASFCHEHPNLAKTDNEKLECLGDSVLNLLALDFLWNRSISEKELSLQRAHLTNKEALIFYTESLGIAEHLLLGKGESQKKASPSLLANLFEALLGAIYLDGGFCACKSFGKNVLNCLFLERSKSFQVSSKTRLQEFVQRDRLGDIFYETVEETGLEHEKQFTIGVKIAGKIAAKGLGSSKKEAEEKAAFFAIEKLFASKQ